jgi:hypothetical protein
MQALQKFNHNTIIPTSDQDKKELLFEYIRPQAKGPGKEST